MLSNNVPIKRNKDWQTCCDVCRHEGDWDFVKTLNVMCLEFTPKDRVVRDQNQKLRLIFGKIVTTNSWLVNKPKRITTLLGCGVKLNTLYCMSRDGRFGVPLAIIICTRGCSFYTGWLLLGSTAPELLGSL